MRRLLPLIFLAACSPSEPAPTEPADAPPVAAAPADPTVPRELTARGTEPFWAVDIKGSGLTLKRPDHPDLVQPNPGGQAEGDKVVWTTPAYRLAISVAACSDGMSDLAYPLGAEITLTGAQTMKGCAGTGLTTADPPPG